MIHLDIWEEAPIMDNLLWYYLVESDQRPAKYLICQTIEVPTALESKSTGELWELQEEFHREFERVFEEVKQGHLDRSFVSPNYLDLLQELCSRIIQECDLCGWECGVNRENGKTGVCKLTSTSRVSSYFHHRGEELIYRGTKGSGTIFFTSCNMRCQFCQNGDISANRDNGIVVSVEDLAAMIWVLRSEGCHNINFVGGDPAIHLHNIVSALNRLNHPPKAETLARVERIRGDYSFYPKSSHYFWGRLNVPMLFNSNFFMSNSSMKLLIDLMDIWLPDIKFFPNECSLRLSKTPRYFETVSKWVKFIYDRGESFSIRHLVMPNHVDCCSIPILSWVQRNVPTALINLMPQYRPEMWADPRSPMYRPELSDISRILTQEEFNRVLRHADELGLNYKTVSFR